MSHLDEIVRSFGADEHRRQFPYGQSLQLLDEISQVLDDPRRRRECLIELDELFGTETTDSGYEWELRSVYHRLIALALREESWEEARKLLAESDALNETASKRQIEGWQPSLRRLNLESRIMTRLQEYDGARAALIRLAREAVGRRGSRSLRGRLLMAVLERLSRIWTLNDEPATTILRDFGHLVEMAGSLDTELIESLYDQAVVLAKARNSPELVSDLGLTTARVLRLSGDPGAAFRLSRKLLTDQFFLYQECGDGRTHLLRALTSFAASGGSEEEVEEWMERVQEEFLKREDFFILGYLKKLQADRALEHKELKTAYECLDEARRFWLERCPRDAELVEALRTVVIGFLLCNRTEQAVELLEQLMEFSIDDQDHRGFFRYYSLLADNGGRLGPELVRRLVGVGLGFYLGQSHFQRRAAFAYETAKLITFFDREAGPLQLGINRYLLSVDFLPANQYHDMAVVHQGPSELELGAALLELSAIEDEKLVREGLSLVTCRNSAQTQAELARIYLEFRWFDQALRAAVKSVQFIGANLRYWSDQPLASTVLEESELLAFDSDVKLYLSAYGVLSQAYREVGGVDQLADPMMLYPLALDFLPMEVSQRATVVGEHFKRVEAALESGLSTDPRYHAVESSNREEVRRRLEEHKRAVKEETESLRLDLFGRRAELEELLWSVLRRADWESSVRLLLSQRGVEEAEVEVEESWERPEVDAEARRRVIAQIVAAWQEQGNPDRAERWRPHLQEAE